MYTLPTLTADGKTEYDFRAVPKIDKVNTNKGSPAG